MLITRRDFLKTGAGVVAVGAGVPALLGAVAHARAAENDRPTSSRSLIVIELAGGNDGLNTVIPIDDPAYTAARPTLAIGKADALTIGDGVALHPAMTALRDLYHAGRLAIVQGVGYPNANRSHFHAMNAWHRGDPAPGTPGPVITDTLDGHATDGWLGRYARLADSPRASRVAVIHHRQPCPELFRAANAGGVPALRIDAIGGAPSPAAPTRTHAVDYPDGAFGEGMAAFARMIVDNTEGRLFFISLGGFDTHARQAESHSRLLAQLSDAIGALLDDLQAARRDKDALVMVFSEFGRRVKENGSAGTDHGAASAMLFAGGAVNGGIHGKHPNLTDLADGDLKYTTDFRDCYATVLEKWLATNPSRVLAGRPGRVDFL